MNGPILHSEMLGQISFTPIWAGTIYYQHVGTAYQLGVALMAMQVVPEVKHLIPTQLGDLTPTMKLYKIFKAIPHDPLYMKKDMFIDEIDFLALVGEIPHQWKAPEDSCGALLWLAA